MSFLILVLTITPEANLINSHLRYQCPMSGVKTNRTIGLTVAKLAFTTDVKMYATAP